MACVDVNWVR